MAEYGRPDFDRTHVFTSAWVYELPFFRNAHNLLAREALSHCGTSELAIIESGFAQTPGLSWGNAGLASRPNIVGPVKYTGKKFPYLTTSAFAPPSFGFVGNAATGSVRGPKEVALNVAVNKTIPIGGGDSQI